MVLPIYAYGHKVLREECAEIEEGTDIKELIKNMYDTMYHTLGVGLAAPQIGKSLRLFIVDGAPFAEGEPEDEREKIDFPVLKTFKQVFINPIIESESGDKWNFSEGCLSIPGIREDVSRKNKVKISYFDEKWNYKEEEYEGIPARIIQHEYDHIEGVLFTDHISPFKKRLLQRKLGDISKGKIEHKYRMVFPQQ
jgi:peptide deformylase